MVLVAWWGTPCTSFSTARKNDGLGPGPLRSVTYPSGLPNLTSNYQYQVDIGNQLARVTAFGLEVAHRACAANVVENPSSSYIWVFERLASALDAISATAVVFDQCAHGTPWRKRTLLKGILEGLPSLGLLCRPRARSRLCSFTGRPHVQLKGQAPCGKYWTLVAQPYPESFNDAVARIILAGADRGCALAGSSA